ncbi:hypothetical protein AK88_05393, partial [Plasmodium fragile]
MRKKKKTLRRNVRQIEDHLKKIEQECSQLSKHIRKVEEERKEFVITTALLKKYHSYVDSSLMNGVSIFSSSSVFVKSCGILFSWKTILEDPDNDTEDACCSGYAERRHSDYAMGGSHMIVEGALHRRNKLLWREAAWGSSPPEVGYADSCSSSFGHNRVSRKKVKCGAASFPPDGTSWSDRSGGAHGCISGHDSGRSSGQSSADNSGELWRDWGNVGRKEKSLKKKNSAVRPNRSYYSGEQGNTHKHRLLDSFEERKKGGSKEEDTVQHDKRDERNVPNQLSHFTHALGNVGKGKCGKFSASPLHPGEGDQRMPRLGSHSEKDSHGDGENDEDARQHYKSDAHSYVDMIRTGKVFSLFMNRTQNKHSNPFYHFVHRVRKILFLSEKEGDQNGRCASDKEKNELMSSLKFTCLVKSKKFVMYACVCPHCEKKFYLLLKKSARKKIMPRVLSPSQFASIITLLRGEQWSAGGEGGMATSTGGKEDIPHLDNQSVEYICDSVMAPHESGENSGEHFCNCYVGMDDGGGEGLFGDANVLAYLLFVKLTFYKRVRYTFYQNYVEQKLSLYSEESFYFSFYDDIVNAETYLEGIKLLIHDDRSEYPNTINAIRRFNIYPEIILGTVWRAFNLKERFLTPFNFYVYAVLLSQAASVSTLFFFAVYLGRSYISGVIFLMLFFSCYREKFIMRLSAFPLRENFSLVYMWCNILLIYTILRESKKRRTAYLVCLFLSSFLFFITWQFSVFVTLTHVVALFGLDLLGFDIQKELHSILVTLSCSYTCSLLVTFFPRYLMCTYLPFVLASLIITNAIYPRRGGNAHDGRREPVSNLKDVAPCQIDPSCTSPLQFFPHLRTKVGFILQKGFTSIMIFLLLRLTMVGMEKDDSHVMSLLKVRLHLSSHNFDSMIYSLGSEFNPFTKYMFNMIKETSLYDYFIFFNLILLLYVVNYVIHIWRARRGRNAKGGRSDKREKKDEQGGSDKLASYDKGVDVRFEIFHAQFLYLIIQFIFFAFLMLIISRLRVLALPLMCLLSSLVGSPHLLGDIYRVTRENLFHLGASKKNLSRLVIQAICLL